MFNEVTYRMWTSAPDGSEREELSGSFPADESGALVNFDREVDRLAATTLMREGTVGQLSVHFNAQGNVTAQLPPRPIIAEFLLQLRPFVLNDESTYFNRVANILSRRIASVRYRALIAELKAIFSGDRFHDRFQVSAAGADVNTDETLKKWLNAYEYHRDEEQRQALESLFPALSKDACEVFLLGLLQEKAIAVVKLGDLVRGLLLAPSNTGPKPAAG